MGVNFVTYHTSESFQEDVWCVTFFLQNLEKFLKNTCISRVKNSIIKVVEFSNKFEKNAEKRT